MFGTLDCSLSPAITFPFLKENKNFYALPYEISILIHESYNYAGKARGVYVLPAGKYFGCG